MSRAFPRAFVAFFLLAGVPASAQEPPRRLPAVAVLAFSIDDHSGKADALTSLVEAELAERGFKVVDRRTLESVLEEQAMSVAGITDPSVVATVGRLSGAKLLIGGRLLDTREEIVFSLRLTSTETAEIKPAKIVFKPRTPVSKIATGIAEKVQALATSAVAAPEAAPGESEKVTALVAAAAGRELPALVVSIPEHHIGRRIPDPAAETEIIRVLHKVGFPVMRAKGVENPPPLRLEGEAFSEFGMQAGRLVSCRARVEVKVVDTGSGKVLFADSEHASGVDVSENIAGKNALRTAGAQLGPRIAEFLLKPNG